MKDLWDHIGAMYEALRREQGEFDFFALLEPEDALGHWDLMLSAPWLDDTLAGRAIIGKVASKHLTQWDRKSLGMTVIRPKDYDGIPALAADQPPGVQFPAMVANIEIGGAPIRQAVIFHLPPPPAKRATRRRPARAGR